MCNYVITLKWYKQKDSNNSQILGGIKSIPSPVRGAFMDEYQHLYHFRVIPLHAVKTSSPAIFQQPHNTRESDQVNVTLGRRSVT